MAVQPTGSTPPSSSSQPTVDVHRLLVVTSEATTDDRIVEEVQRRVRDRDGEVFVVAPALTSPLKVAVGEVDEAIDEARTRLDESLQALQQAGVHASGHVGEADPMLATEDGLRMFPADEVVIVTHPEGESQWLEKDLVKRAREELSVPITHIVVQPPSNGGSPTVERVERVPPAPAARDAEEERPDYLPPLASRDRFALVIGTLGTIALGLLALECAIDQEWRSITAGCAARALLALGAFMITVWHGVALLLMGSVRYTGFWAAAAAYSVIWGIPTAIVVSLIVG